MDPWGNPALPGSSCEDLPFRTIRSCLLLTKEEMRPSLLHLMHAILCTHARTLATSLMMCVLNSKCYFYYDTYRLGHWNETNERSKTSNLMIDHLLLTFVKTLVAWMLYFHVWLQNKGNILSLEWILYSVWHILNIPVYSSWKHSKTT